MELIIMAKADYSVLPINPSFKAGVIGDVNNNKGFSPEPELSIRFSLIAEPDWLTPALKLGYI